MSPRTHGKLLMPLNQLLHDEQLIMRRAARSKDWREAEDFRRQLIVLDAKIAAYPIRNRSGASKPTLGEGPRPDQSLTLPVEIPSGLLAAVDAWAGAWAVSCLIARPGCRGAV